MAWLHERQFEIESHARAGSSIDLRQWTPLTRLVAGSCPLYLKFGGLRTEGMAVRRKATIGRDRVEGLQHLIKPGQHFIR
jgi:hypothetical protein